MKHKYLHEKDKEYGRLAKLLPLGLLVLLFIVFGVAKSVTFMNRAEYNAAVEMDVNGLQSSYSENLKNAVTYINNVEASKVTAPSDNIISESLSVISEVQKICASPTVKYYYQNAGETHYNHRARKAMITECENARAVIDFYYDAISRFGDENSASNADRAYIAAAKAYLLKASEYMTAPKTLCRNGSVEYESNYLNCLDPSYVHENDTTCRQPDLDNYYEVTTTQMKLCLGLIYR